MITKLKVGQRIKILTNTLNKFGIRNGDVISVTSLRPNAELMRPYCLGFVHNYDSHPAVSAGLQPNWNLVLGRDYIILPGYTNQPPSLKERYAKV